MLKLSRQLFCSPGSRQGWRLNTLQERTQFFGGNFCQRISSKILPYAYLESKTSIHTHTFLNLQDCKVGLV
ncbi:MAG: hypothetical protein ANABAC_3005 [Anaerolineae bacterium]|nr:MAG: hypothetical protein ANABAC_3005 [Anaerolineae bacterium]